MRYAVVWHKEKGAIEMKDVFKNVYVFVWALFSAAIIVLFVGGLSWYSVFLALLGTSLVVVCTSLYLEAKFAEYEAKRNIQEEKRRNERIDDAVCKDV